MFDHIPSWEFRTWIYLLIAAAILFVGAIESPMPGMGG